MDEDIEMELEAAAVANTTPKARSSANAKKLAQRLQHRKITARAGAAGMATVYIIMIAFFMSLGVSPSLQHVAFALVYGALFAASYKYPAVVGFSVPIVFLVMHAAVGLFAGIDELNQGFFLHITEVIFMAMAVIGAIGYQRLRKDVVSAKARDLVQSLNAISSD
jgi:hypothetical protein